MEVLLFLLGIVGGIFAGLVPGIGVFTTLILLYPLLIDLTITQLLILYIPLMSVSQYIGSVPALYFKIPGEATSFIATEYGHDLFWKGNYDLIPLTAIGSFVATVMSAGVIMLLPYLYEHIFYGFLSTNFVFGMILLTGACLVATCKNPWLLTVTMIATGMALGNVGFNVNTGTNFATFGSTWLSYGIPIFPFIIAVYVIPSIFALNSSTVTVKQIDSAYSSAALDVKHYLPKMMSGSMVGMIAGFVPIIGKIVGVSASRALYKHNDKHSVIVAESSNNSSIFTAMIPLFLFGVPITLGEILIFNVAETSYWDLDTAFREVLSTPTLPVTILASGIFGLVLSWPLARYFSHVFVLPTSALKICLLAIVLGSMIYLGITKHMLGFYIIVLLAFIPLGYFLRHRDVIPLIFAFIFAKMSMTVIERIII